MMSHGEISNHKIKDLSPKSWINLALEKANIAVKYDMSNDFHNAICAYTEAVELLVCVLQQPPDKENDTEGLKSICNIYLERIDFLSYLQISEENRSQQQQHDKPSTEKNDIVSSSASPKQNSFNNVLMNIFSKKSTKKKKSITSNLFNFSHQHSKEQHKSINVEPKSSKSSPIFPLEHSKWSKQARSKNHHMLSDNILSQRPSSYSSSTANTNSNNTKNALYFQQPMKDDINGKKYIRRNSQQDNSNDGQPMLSDNNHNRQRQQFSSGGPFITDKQYNTSSMMHRSNYCYPSVPSIANTEDKLRLPRKSSQRRKRSSPPLAMPSTNQGQEPIRDSSLNHSWGLQTFSPKNMTMSETCSSATTTSDSSNSNAAENDYCLDSNLIPIMKCSLAPPPPDKSNNRTSTSSLLINKRISSRQLKTTFSLTNCNTIKSGGAITPTSDDKQFILSPTQSIMSDKTTSTTTTAVAKSIPKIIEIDPNIILSYPEATVAALNENILNGFVSNESPSTATKLGSTMQSDKLYILK